MFCASRQKSSSSTIVSANNSTSAGGFAKAATGMRPTNSGAIQLYGGQVAAQVPGVATLGALHLDDHRLPAG